jgi:hypothetical protein
MGVITRSLLGARLSRATSRQPRRNTSQRLHQQTGLAPRISRTRPSVEPHAVAQFLSDFKVARHRHSGAQSNEIIDGKAKLPNGALSFRLTGLEGQCHFCDAAGDVETLATFEAQRLQRD